VAEVAAAAGQAGAAAWVIRMTAQPNEHGVFEPTETVTIYYRPGSGGYAKVYLADLSGWYRIGIDVRVAVSGFCVGYLPQITQTVYHNRESAVAAGRAEIYDYLTNLRDGRPEVMAEVDRMLEEIRQESLF